MMLFLTLNKTQSPTLDVPCCITLIGKSPLKLWKKSCVLSQIKCVVIVLCHVSFNVFYKIQKNHIIRILLLLLKLPSLKMCYPKLFWLVFGELFGECRRLYLNPCLIAHVHFVSEIMINVSIKNAWLKTSLASAVKCTNKTRINTPIRN